MSAYVVDDSTINKIVAYLVNAAQKNEHSAYLLQHGNFEDNSPCYDLNKADQAKRLAIRMFALNVRSVDERYGKNSAKEFRDLNFTYMRTMPISDLQAYRMLSCWLYQSCEGKTSETKLYRLMVAVKHAIADKIIHNLPGFTNISTR